MARQLQMVAVKDALLALLSGRLPESYGVAVDVQESGDKDFDNAGQLVLKRVAVRVRMGDAEFNESRDTSLTTLGAVLRYQVICRHESQRSENEQRDRTLDLAAAVCEELAGARLALPDGSLSPRIQLRTVGPVSDQFGPVTGCWGVGIQLTGSAQFDGRKAQGTTTQPGGGA